MENVDGSNMQLFILTMTAFWLIQQIKCDEARYTAYTDQVSQEDAAKACKENGGILAQPKTNKEQKAMVEVLKRPESGYSQFWIGLKRRQRDAWDWLDGTPLSDWNSWGPGLHWNRGRNQHCVEHRLYNQSHSENDGWNDEDCSVELQYVCESCFGKFKTDCYTAYTDQVSQQNAAKACKDEGGILAQPKTNKEQKAMVTVLKRPDSGYSQFWIGLKRRHLDDWDDRDDWDWPDGTPLSDWDSWGPDLPYNKGGKQHCVEHRLYNQSHSEKDGWNDEDCHVELQYVCEFCSECPNGTFGLNCTNKCHCNDVCDKIDGRCLSGCLKGWKGRDCQQEIVTNESTTSTTQQIDTGQSTTSTTKQKGQSTTITTIENSENGPSTESPKQYMDSSSSATSTTENKTEYKSAHMPDVDETSFLDSDAVKVIGVVIAIVGTVSATVGVLAMFTDVFTTEKHPNKAPDHSTTGQTKDLVQDNAKGVNALNQAVKDVSSSCSCQDEDLSGNTEASLPDAIISTGKIESKLGVKTTSKSPSLRNSPSSFP